MMEYLYEEVFEDLERIITKLDEYSNKVDSDEDVLFIHEKATQLIELKDCLKKHAQNI